MNKLQREMMAFQLREEGLTFKAIGEHFGLSVERARQMVASHKNREKEISSTDDILKKELACSECAVVRILNCLTNAGLSGDIDTVVKLGGRKILSLKNLGKKSARSIAGALERLGKIENADVWMDT